MKISIVVPPVVYARQAPIGPAYIASYLKSKGYEVQSLDLNTETFIPNDCDDEFWRQEANCAIFFQRHKNLFDEWAEKILAFNPQIIGFSIWENSEYMGLKLAEIIKKKNKDILIVFGGCHCSYQRRPILNPAVDIVVYGEGEETIFDIIEIYKDKAKVEYCKGCLLKKDGRVIDCGSRPEIDNLNDLPFPDFSGFQLDKYLFKCYIPISFSRGCVWRCIYCATPFRWKKVRLRSAENIYQEIMYRLKSEEYPKLDYFQNFQICDPALNPNLNIISRLCDLIIADGFKVRFEGFVQIKPGMDFEMLKKMRKAGFVVFDFGIESGSQKVLDSMGRPYSVELAEQVIKDTHNAGIEVVLNFIVGYPNETEEDFNETLKFIERIKGYVSNIGLGHPCDIQYSYIYSHPDEFDIVILGDSPHRSRCPDWRRKDGSNTLEERHRRAKIFNDFVRSLGISNRSPAEDREFLLNYNG